MKAPRRAVALAVLLAGIAAAAAGCVYIPVGPEPGYVAAPPAVYVGPPAVILGPRYGHYGYGYYGYGRHRPYRH
jgi:hypothetical protein